MCLLENLEVGEESIIRQILPAYYEQGTPDDGANMHLKVLNISLF